MTLLHEATEAKKLDIRMIERNITRGALSAEDADKAAKKLTDDAENAEYVSIETLANDGSES